MPRILIAEDHPLFREAVRGVVEQVFAPHHGGTETIEAASAEELEAATPPDTELDLVVLDLFMPGAHGLSHLVGLRARLPATPIVIFSSVTDARVVRQAITCGAAGYIPKSASRDEIAGAFATIMAGGIYLPRRFSAEYEAASLRPRALDDADHGPLTGRQAAVLELVAAGKANKQIAYELGISEITVKTHVTAILRKLRVTNRGQAIVMFQRHLSLAAI
jgi:DNA-binding NarL/FixJ family response regulator